MTQNRLLILIGIAIAAWAGWQYLGDILTLENFRAQQADIRSWVAARPLQAAVLFFGLYAGITAISIPGAAVLTLIAGALFGVFQGTIIVSFASTLGATLAFLLSRYLLRDMVEQKLSETLKRVNSGLDKDGAFYLFTLRLIPAFPFWAINMVMGLTRIKTLTYCMVSQIGMLPATIIYVNAGTQIAQLDSLSGILSPMLLASFAALGLFPLFAKKLLNRYQIKRKQKLFPKPKSYDTNMVVIGAGSAGLVTAYIAAAAGAKVTLVEKEKMGGDCLNTGCVPSKALIRSSKIKSYLDRSREFGIDSGGQAKIEFPQIMQRVRNIIAAIEPHDSVERYTALGVDCLHGQAKITSPWTVDVDGQTITTRSIVIASGGSPAVPAIPGVSEIDYLTSDTLWQLEELPERLLVLGGGAIGCELSQAFCRLGSQVTQVEMLPRLLAAEDEAVSRELEASFRNDGITVLTNSKAERFEGNTLIVCTSEGQQRIEFDKVLIATGRRGNSDNIGLDTLGIEANRNGTIPVNEYLQTVYPNVYACGDVAGPYQLTHAAAHQAWYCAMNALFGRFWKFAVDYSVLPRAVFTDPEVASVGLSEQAAVAQDVPHEITTYGIDDLDRAIADSEAKGFVQVITPPGSDRILGVTIVGPHAGEIISEYVLAMRNKLGLSKILGTVHIYPTLTEANKFAAGNWRKSHLNPKLLQLSAWLNRNRLN